jgi:hypothetical protein
MSRVDNYISLPVVYQKFRIKFLSGLNKTLLNILLIFKIFQSCIQNKLGNWKPSMKEKKKEKNQQTCKLETKKLLWVKQKEKNKVLSKNVHNHLKNTTINQVHTTGGSFLKLLNGEKIGRGNCYHFGDCAIDKHTFGLTQH